MVYIKKEAQKGVKDPVQKKLRDNKKQWSKDTSTLIAQLIAFKRGLNGRGDPKAGIPPSNIKDPLPKEVESYLNQMFIRFQDITQRADKIINEQEEYSKNRKKSNKELQNITSSYNFDKVQKLARIIDRSDTLTRLWTVVSQYPLFGEDEKLTRERIRIMYSAADYEAQINEIEYKLTSFDDDYGPTKSFYEFSRFIISFDQRWVQRFKNLITHQASYYDKNKEKIKPPPPPSSNSQAQELRAEQREDNSQEDNDAQQAIENAEKKGKRPKNAPNSPENQVDYNWSEIKDFAKNVLNDLDYFLMMKNLIENNNYIEDITGIERGLSDIQKLAKMVMSSASKKESEGLTDDYNRLQKEYSEYVSNIVKSLNAPNNINTINDINSWLEKNKTSSVNKDELLKFAAKHKFKRWMQRVRLSIYTGEYDRSRLETARLLRDIADNFDIIQFLLENDDVFLAEVSANVQRLYLQLEQACKYYAYIGKYHNYVYGSKRLESGEANIGMINTSQIKVLEDFSKQMSKNAEELSSIVIPDSEKNKKKS